MVVLYGRYEMLESLTAYKVRPALKDLLGKFETGMGNFEGMCGVFGALEYIEWVGETFGAEHVERYESDYSRRQLRFRQGMAAVRSYEFELSRALLDILAETPGVPVYGIMDTRRLEERVPTYAFTMNVGEGLETRPVPSRQVVLHSVRDKLRSWMRKISMCGMGIIMPWRLPYAWGWKRAVAWCG